jgi:hypothetical protein
MVRLTVSSLFKTRVAREWLALEPIGRLVDLLEPV